MPSRHQHWLEQYTPHHYISTILLGSQLMPVSIFLCDINGEVMERTMTDQWPLKLKVNNLTLHIWHTDTGINVKSLFAVS